MLSGNMTAHIENLPYPVGLRGQMDEPSELEREVAQRLAALERFGFDGERMLRFVNEHPDGALARLEWLDGRREVASEIEDRIVGLSEVVSYGLESVEAFRTELSNPFEMDDVHRAFERAVRSVASWEPPLNRVRSLWHHAGLGETWNLLYRRLAGLDPSSGPAVEPFHRLFGEPERHDEMFRHLETVEEDERRQRAVIEEGVADLRQRGMDVGDLASASLLDALGALEDWQAFHDERERVRLSVAQFIEPFDADLALEFSTRVHGLLQPNQRAELGGLKEEVAHLAHTLEERRKALSHRLASWRTKGVVFPHEGELRPGDLLEWETNHDMVEASVESHLAVVERWKRFATYWPSRTAASEHLVGHLDKTEALLEAVENLDNLWKKVELDALDVLQGYENAGLDVADWRNLVFEDPLHALERLTSTRSVWERRVVLLRRLGEIDVSSSGMDDVDVRRHLLSNENLDDEVLDEIEEFTQRLERRQARHRTMLEDELAAVRRAGRLVEERNTDRMSLQEFERYIGSLQRHHPSTSPTAEEGLSASMLKALKDELQQLAEQGWLVGHWLDLVPGDAMDVARSLSQARPFIATHDALRRRLTRLPWANDVRLAAKVELMLKQPDQLEVLSQNIPAWAGHLAQRPTEQDGFIFSAWQPAHSHPTLLPVRETVHPVLRPTSSLDDAHEAILEAMEEPNPQAEDEEGVEKEEHEEMSSEEIQPVEIQTGGGGESLSAPEQPLPALPAVIETMVANGDDHRSASDEPVAVHVSKTMGEDEETSPTPPTEGTQEALENLVRLLSLLNLNDLANEVSDSGLQALPGVRRGLAPHVNVEPRDVRIARLLRLTLRLLPQGDESDDKRAALLLVLAETVAPLKRWMRRRLEARHSGARGDFLDDAAELGLALERIPGLGKHVPLERDTWPLSNDLLELSAAVQHLRKVVFLPSAGGVQA